MAKRSLIGLSGPFSRTAEAHCPRCAANVSATWPWGGWRNLRRAWFVGTGFLACVAPAWMGDMYVLMPSAMLFVFAGGPLTSLARIRPTCLRCGAVVSAVRLRLVDTPHA